MIGCSLREPRQNYSSHFPPLLLFLGLVLPSWHHSRRLRILRFVELIGLLLRNLGVDNNLVEDPAAAAAAAAAAAVTGPANISVAVDTPG